MHAANQGVGRFGNTYDSTTVSIGGIHAMPRSDVLRCSSVEADVPPADKPAVPVDKPAVPVKTDDATIHCTVPPPHYFPARTPPSTSIGPDWS